MEQSKWDSLEETLVNVGTGFILALIFQHFVVPMITGKEATFVQNIYVTLFFTVISLIRGYFFRRIYNKHKGFITRLLRKFYERRSNLL